MKKIRVFLIEDNRLLREGITTTLNGQADFMVVAAPKRLTTLSTFRSILFIGTNWYTTLEPVEVHFLLS
jgi:hypothetical protein